MKTRNLLLYALVFCLCISLVITACNNPTNNVSTSAANDNGAAGDNPANNENPGASGDGSADAIVSSISSGGASGTASAAANASASGNTSEVTTEDLETVRTSPRTNAAMDTVIFKVGDISVTFAEFVLQFRIIVDAFVYSGQYVYSTYDPDLPLDEQYYDEDKEITWYDMFSGRVNDSLQRNLAMYQEALTAGYQIEGVEKDYVDGFLKFIEDSSWGEGITADEYIAQRYGDGLTFDMAKEFQLRYWTGVGYEANCRGTVTFTDDEIKAYYDDIKDLVNLPDCNVVTIRNLFIYDKEVANDVFTMFGDGDRSEESFVKYVYEYSEDENSKLNGGLIENYQPANTEAGFTDIEAWMFDSERVPGEIKIYEWENGMEMLYFVSQGEPYWLFWSRDDMMERYFDDIMAKYPVDYLEG